MHNCEDKNSSLPEVHVPVPKNKAMDKRKKLHCIIILLICVLLVNKGHQWSACLLMWNTLYKHAAWDETAGWLLACSETWQVNQLGSLWVEKRGYVLKGWYLYENYSKFPLSHLSK